MKLWRASVSALRGHGQRLLNNRFLSSRFGPSRHDVRTASALNSLDLFRGEWISPLPGHPDGGLPPLFDDQRIRYFDSQIGGFAGKRVIELGPLEASHTCMISQLGAVDILAIESNRRAFLRCLVVQNALRLRTAQFLLGDFLSYLESSAPRVDVIVACGVLYHMHAPLKLIEAMAKRTDAICVWSHYYAEGHRRQFAEQSTFVNFHGAHIEMRHRAYDNQHRRISCGGTSPTSFWLTRDGLLDAFRALGFAVDIGADEPSHPAGAAILFTALRK